MKKYLVVVFSIVLLGACGFHLKGSHTHHLPSQAWHIQGGEMQDALERAVRLANGVSSNDASTRLEVEQLSKQRDLLTVTRAALANEYLLVLRVRVQAYQQGEKWGDAMNITVRRSMNYADSAVLGKTSEENQLWQDMYADAAEQVVRRLTFLKAQ